MCFSFKLIHPSKKKKKGLPKKSRPLSDEETSPTGNTVEQTIENLCSLTHIN